MKLSDIAFNIPEDEIKLPEIEKTGDERSFDERFQKIKRNHPQRIALKDETGTMTFSELDRLSGAIARFVLEKDLPWETPVGVMCQRSNLFVAAFLGILRAGAIYVPLDPLLPLMRREIILKDCKARLLITDHIFAGDAQRLQYTCPKLTFLLCPDVENFEDAIETPGDLMSIELWNHVTADASDASWKSFFDGQPLSPRILDELAENLYKKTESRLGPESYVLDIGSGSGLAAQKVMGHCKRYTSVDLSRKELERVKETALTFKGLKVDTHQVEAIDIQLLALDNYDLVILNSVIENFPGFNYLRKVLDQAVTILKDGGVLFIGNVWDLDKKSLFMNDLKKYGEKTKDFSGMGRLEQGNELFVPKSFFREWAETRQGDVQISFSSSNINFAELSDYNFDLVVTKVEKEKPDSLQPLVNRYGSCALIIKENIDFVPLSLISAVYIIYTSGTTGKPKGVVIEQEGLLNLVNGLQSIVYEPAWQKEPVQIALLASFSFDASMQQIATALLGGHCLCIVPDKVKQDPRALYHFLEKHAIALCDGTPSLFSLLTDYCLEHQLTCPVNTFILGGEVLRNNHLSRYFSIEGHRDCRLFNAYGPTESCVDASLYEINFSNHNTHGTPPIGYPLPNTDISVRDKNMAALPDGIPGELWIRGKGVARGYWNDEKLTASRFIIAEGQRWYRTGDIGRRMKNNLFFFTGRDDRQVKVGGFRVETGEVETILNNCPLVEKAAVMANDFSGTGVNTLACYIVPIGHMDVSRIRTYLKRHLPAYAIPNHYIAMTALPITTSGKIDFHNLPSPLHKEKSKDAEPAQPLSGPVEKKIARIWEQLLGHKIESATCDFFESGGHSILGIRLILLLEQEFDRRLSLSHLFKATTITSQAKLIDEKKAVEHQYKPIIPFSSVTEKKPIFLFHPVGGHALCYKPLANALSDRYMVYGVEAPGINADSARLLSVEEMAETYLSAILELVPDEPVIFAGWSFGGLVAFEAARRLELQGGKVRGLILLDTVADNRMAKELIQQDEASMLVTLLSENLPMDKDFFLSLNGDEKIDYLIKTGTSHGLLPSGFSPEKMRRLLQIYHENALAAARYKHPKSQGKALLIRPDDPSASALNIPNDPLQGWDETFQDGISLCWMSGNHETMLQENSAGELAGHIQRYLDENDN